MLQRIEIKDGMIENEDGITEIITRKEVVGDLCNCIDRMIRIEEAAIEAEHAIVDEDCPPLPSELVEELKTTYGLTPGQINMVRKLLSGRYIYVDDIRKHDRWEGMYDFWEGIEWEDLHLENFDKRSFLTVSDEEVEDFKNRVSRLKNESRDRKWVTK